VSHSSPRRKSESTKGLRFSLLWYRFRRGIGVIIVDAQGLHRGAQGWVVNRFHFAGDPQSPQRGLASTRQQQPRFVGSQVHSGQVLFRHIQWKAL
jgi:hypothetical protein